MTVRTAEMERRGTEPTGLGNGLGVRSPEVKKSQGQHVGFWPEYLIGGDAIEWHRHDQEVAGLCSV